MGDEEIETANNNYFEGLALKRNEKIRTGVGVGCRGRNNSPSELLFFNGRELNMFKSHWGKTLVEEEEVEYIRGN